MTETKTLIQKAWINSLDIPIDLTVEELSGYKEVISERLATASTTIAIDALQSLIKILEQITFEGPTSEQLKLWEQARALKK